MAEKNDGAVKKIATREGYGEALLELGAEYRSAGCGSGGSYKNRCI